MTQSDSSLLDISDLTVTYGGAKGTSAAVDGVSLRIAPGETVGLVGESGSGKSTLAMSIFGLVSSGARVTGSVRYERTELVGISEARLRRIRRDSVGFVFQNPLGALNPVYTVGRQFADVIVRASHIPRRDALHQAEAALEKLSIPHPGRCLRSYPHQLSGGMRQRVLIAMAMSGAPKLLVADEPTTALDVLVQQVVMESLRIARDELHSSLLLITHDLRIVENIADRIVIMKAGRIVEEGMTRQIFESPRHPYSRRLLAARDWKPIDDDGGVPAAAVPQTGAVR